MPDRHSTVLVSGEAPWSEVLVTLLRTRQCRPIVVCDPDRLASAAEEEPVELVILSGSFAYCQPFLRYFAAARTRQALPPLLIIASSSSEDFAIACLRAGAAEYLQQPLDPKVFLESVSRWLPECAKAPVQCELAGGEVLVGGSPVMQALRAQIRRVAATDCNVLITGETGTGKELVAQLIHQNSPRRANPLICINCAAIPDSLLESELFGYEKGAFTGATLANQGKLMAANRGTVFFDEIGDMSPLAQSKILRAIESKEVQRLGASRRYDTDIRIIGATHHNLDDLASAETFRRDLYFRLNVGRIYLPPLRERKGDISALVERMVKDLSKKSGGRVAGVSSAAIRSLNQYNWPGNVRELKNVLERALIMLEGERIEAHDLANVLPPMRKEPASEKECEMRSLEEALEMCNGNKSKAAERLNWSRMTLYRKLAKYRGPEGHGKAGTSGGSGVA